MICKGKGSIILVINNRLVENILFGFWFWELAFAFKSLTPFEVVLKVFLERAFAKRPYITYSKSD